MKINVNGANLNYQIDGPEGAPWVTMSNSLMTTHRMWDAQMEALTAHYRVLRYDKRGHGESDAPEGPYSFELLGDDVFALLEALNITRTHFIGLSMGGMTGMTMALKDPSRLRTLILCDTASDDPMGDPAAWQARIDTAKAGGIESVVESTIQRFLAPATIHTQPQATDAVRAMIRSTSLTGYIACCQAISKLNLSHRLSQINVPTLVVVGAQDPATTVEMAHAIHQGIPGAELAILENAAHLSNIDQAEAFNTTVLAFLAHH